MRVFVVGNIAMDETLAVDALPAAGASVIGKETSRDLGGKGANQAIVLARCGLRTTLVAVVGGGFRANEIAARLQSEPVDTCLIENASLSTDASIVLAMANGENAIVTTTAAAESLRPEQARNALRDAAAGDLVVLQGNLVAETTRAILEFARSRDLVTAVNPSPLRPFFTDLLPLIDIVFANSDEALAMTGCTGAGAAEAFLDRGCACSVVTLGAKGAVVAAAGTLAHIPANAVKVVDTTGAGDSFMAVALASALNRLGRADRTMVDERAIRHAAHAATLTVSRWGTQSAFPSESELSDILGSLR